MDTQKRPNTDRLETAPAYNKALDDSIDDLFGIGISATLETALQNAVTQFFNAVQPDGVLNTQDEKTIDAMKALYYTKLNEAVTNIKKVISEITFDYAHYSGRTNRTLEEIDKHVTVCTTRLKTSKV